LCPFCAAASFLQRLILERMVKLVVGLGAFSMNDKMGLQGSYDGRFIEAGCDEAGRGCLAGPVYAAAVILPCDFEHPLLDDSKKLTALQRKRLREAILADALDYGVAAVDNEEIDELNIFRSSIVAMHRALDQLTERPELLLIDGKFFHSYRNLPHRCIIGGDGRYLSIAAASVLAKTYRDDYMESLHREHPEYNWKSNKGYATAQHRKALQEYGISPYHRRSFRLLPEGTQLGLDGLNR